MKHSLVQRADNSFYSKIQSLESNEIKTEKIFFLPSWEETDRAIPNHIARSSLFSPIARGTRILLDKEVIASRSDVTIMFSGKQLDEADCDVWMQTLHEARFEPLGSNIKINRARFLKVLGRAKGSSGYKWLHDCLERLAFAMISVETKNYSIGMKPGYKVLHLIEGFNFDSVKGGYNIRIDPEARKLFSRSEFALVDWRKRMQIKSSIDMAKWLQRIIATSSDVVQRYAIEELKIRMNYSGQWSKFRLALGLAMNELERLDIISGSRIEKSKSGRLQVAWTRVRK